MKKKTALIIAFTAAAAVLICIYLLIYNKSGGLHTAVVSFNGEVIRRIDLSSAPDEVFTVGDGEQYNVITVQDGTVFVSEASCPDKICVKHGKLESEYLPIICLPNKLVIELE